MSSILLAEDDANLAALVRAYLERDGFAVTTHNDGRDALRAAKSGDHDLVLLDIMLPGLDGWEICRELRRISQIPIVVLTARIDEADRIAGLRLGADDYVVKPFSPAEVVERVKAVLRRSAPPKRTESDAILRAGPVTLSSSHLTVTVKGASVALTRSEFKILEAMMKSPGRVFTRDQLLVAANIHGDDVIDRAVDVHIVNLRRKIETDPTMPQIVQTVRGVGYRIAEAP